MGGGGGSREAGGRGMLWREGAWGGWGRWGPGGGLAAVVTGAAGGKGEGGIWVCARGEALGYQGWRSLRLADPWLSSLPLSGA